MPEGEKHVLHIPEDNTLQKVCLLLSTENSGNTIGIFKLYIHGTDKTIRKLLYRLKQENIN